MAAAVGNNHLTEEVEMKKLMSVFLILFTFMFASEGWGWTFCANEGSHCSFKGVKRVRYGAEGAYYYGTFSNGVSCSNGQFGDPYPGLKKHCFFEDLKFESYHNFKSWLPCAYEGAHCGFSGIKWVRYGAEGVYIYQLNMNGVSCSNGQFGDPYPGLKKNCSIGYK